MAMESAKHPHTYLREDGVLMIEVRPREFISETAARLGLVHPNFLAKIDRIKGNAKRSAGRKARKPMMS